MRQFLKKYFWLILIVLLAAFLRFYNLSSNPPSLNWDEVAIGWNAKTIFHTRRDEYGTKLPLSFQSYGDWKSPLYIYLTAPIVGFFGMNPITVRLLSVMVGIFSIILIYLITKKLLKPVIRNLKPVALLSALLLAVSPWHILLSRPAYEANLALFFTLLGIWLFLKSLNQAKYFIFSALSFVFSLYTYHSSKIFVPFFLLGLTFIYSQKLLLKKSRKWLIISAALGTLLLFPLIKETFFAKSASRFQAVSIFYNKEGEKLPLDLPLFIQLGKNYLIHYSPAYLFSGSDQMPRLQMEKVGPLLLIQFPFLISGLIYLIYQRKQQWSKFLFLWLVIAGFPAMIGFETPHPIRSYNLLPALTIITALGINNLKKLLNKQILKILLIVLFIINVGYFIYRYFTVYPIYSASYWQYGYNQAVQTAREHEDQVDKIIFTGKYGQPHMFTYFYQQRKPLTVFWGGMIKYLFRDIKWQEDQYMNNVLLIGTGEEIPAGAEGIIKEIKFPDGETAFRIVKL